ncbi:unnamed protein product [Heterobilharzia americana]|nr:unnamed protein product [Heterobilharzia americana]
MLKTHFGYILHRSYCDSAFKFISGELFHPDHFHVKAVTNLLAGVHNQLNLPWGTSIATTSILVRTVAALPLYICAERNQAKVAHVAVDCLKNRQLLTAKLTNSDYYRHLSSGTQMLLENRMFRSIFLKICQDNGCHPLKSAVTGIIQIPLWLTFTFSLRYMSGYSLYPQCDLGTCNLLVYINNPPVVHASAGNASLHT